jgi:tetratricopeptide (TPR) repeat protein
MSNPSPDPNGGSPPAETGGQVQKEFEQAIRSFGEATEAGKQEEAMQAAFGALMLAAQEAETNPTPDMLLAKEASDREEAGDWVAAEETYRKLVALQARSGNAGLLAKAQMNLSRLLRLLARLDEAWDFALAASDSARAFYFSILVSMALENQSMCALARAETNLALEAASQAVESLDRGKLTLHRRARALIQRADCSLACGDVPGAETSLKESWDNLAQKTVSGLAGPLGTLSQWREVRAQLDAAKGNLSAAMDGLNESIQYYRQRVETHDSKSPHAAAALARMLQTLASLAQRRGHSAAAQEAISEARRLRERAHLPLQ